MDVRINRIGETRDLLGESPCWDEQAKAVCWIDALAGTLWRLYPAQARLERHLLPAPVGAIAPCQSDAVVAALRNSFARYDFETRALEVLAYIPVDHPDVRFNDGKCDPFGNFLAGTMHLNRRPGERVRGGLYRLRPNCTVEQLAGDIGFANGPCFSPDASTLYLADSLERKVWAYDYHPDKPLGNKRLFVDTQRFDSGPDGATVDVEGFYWTVLTRAAALARFSPRGELERLLPLPATYPTSLCFGGPGFAQAFVTSISRSTRLEGTRPDDGGIFLIDGLPAAGRTVDRFADR
ncbi:SMP-30/gluconolactonase/LRE family protein [Variovorax dokdonensis]|uniref:Regucalcin n=1 Tax=Variovorax dokdonensis TaxID=344883 RepID=A0ABT7N4M6_9BURK|nr:SMP-30/gluconolactonase/LRE family protein [Variovorax dokdonensis]MDM0042896.1 SMP-30/gluconolactonase/LRE family protein [Variovorax dokdonensis]